MDVLYPLVLFSVFGVALCLVGPAGLGSDERSWLSRWLLVALLIRLTFATIFATVEESRLFHEDASGYEYVGMILARGWLHQGPPVDMSLFDLNYGFYYLSAAIYFVLGLYQPLVAYFNCVLGVAVILFIYRLARRFFHPLVARRAALLGVFTPSMILWSSVASKDVLMSLLILVALDSCVAIKRRFSLAATAGIVFSLLAIQPVRFYMVYFLGFAILTSLFLERGVSLVSGVYKQLIVGGLFVALLVLAGFSGRAQSGLENISFARVSGFRHGMAANANSGFDTDVDISTPGKALVFLPLGVAELLLGPFPWQMGSLRALMAAPETFYWWLLFPGTVRSMWWMFRKRFSATSPLLLFAVIMTLAYSLMHGNLGSGFRQRNQIFVILFIFASLGVYRSRALRAGVDPELLLTDPATEPRA